MFRAQLQQRDQAFTVANLVAIAYFDVGLEFFCKVRSEASDPCAETRTVTPCSAPNCSREIRLLPLPTWLPLRTLMSAWNFFARSDRRHQTLALKRER